MARSVCGHKKHNHNPPKQMLWRLTARKRSARTRRRTDSSLIELMLDRYRSRATTITITKYRPTAYDDLHPSAVNSSLSPSYHFSPAPSTLLSSGQTSAIGSTPSTPRLISGLERIKNLISAVLGQSAFTTKLPHNTHKTPNPPARNLSLKSPLEFRHFLTEMYPTALINSSHQYKNAFVCQFTRACIPYKYYRSFLEA